MASMASTYHPMARPSQGWSPTAGTWSATRSALAATCAVIWSVEIVGSAPNQNGAHAAGLVTGRVSGRPPSGRVTVVNQSQSATARFAEAAPASAMTSKACMPAVGWLSDERRSGSRPQP